MIISPNSDGDGACKVGEVMSYCFDHHMFIAFVDSCNLSAKFRSVQPGHAPVGVTHLTIRWPQVTDAGDTRIAQP